MEISRFRRGRAVVFPGARFEVANGRYRISKIFQGQNEEDLYRSPLTEIGVDLKVGDYVLAVDGEELRSTDDIYRLLRNKADNPVSLTVNSTPSHDRRAHSFVSSGHE